MKILIETFLGVLFIIGAFAAIGWFLFREQFKRLIRYFQSWSEQDSKREAANRRIQEAAEEERRQQLMREASAREKAEAELEQHL
jgi:hypothetical protein